MDTLSQQRIQRFFDQAVGTVPPGRSRCSVVVTHVLEDRPFFLAALNSMAPIKLLLPKPNSVHLGTRDFLSNFYPIETLRRQKFAKAEEVVDLFENIAPSCDLVLLDVGGYFASTLQAVAERYSGRIIAVIEDTENGLRRYETRGNPPIPLYSVARSPLKKPEDFLVGQSIVFSTEALLREQGDVLNGRKSCVVGYGRLGRSIASVLHAKNVRTVIYDTDPVVLVEAFSHGFEVARSVREALDRADLVLCATGNLALRAEDYSHVNNGAYIATVTSSDDELDLTGIERFYQTKKLSDRATLYSTPGHYFYLLNEGNAVNFVHGAVVGPFIQLVQAEILACVEHSCRESDMHPGFVSLPDDVRKTIATRWMECFAHD
jgi:adenosylhomocysteinase